MVTTSNTLLRTLDVREVQRDKGKKKTKEINIIEEYDFFPHVWINKSGRKENEDNGRRSK